MSDARPAIPAANNHRTIPDIYYIATVATFILPLLNSGKIEFSFL